MGNEGLPGQVLIVLVLKRDHMKFFPVALLLSIGIVRLLGQGFVDKNVKVGDTSFALPIPASYVVIDRETEWAKAFYLSKENTFADERSNNTFILAMQTPERFAVSKKKGEVIGKLECWAIYPNFSAKSRVSLKQFATLIAQTESALGKLDQTDKLSDYLGVAPSEIRDEDIRKKFAMMTKPAIIGKTSRTLLTVTMVEETYILQAWVLVNGKLLFVYLNKEKDQLVAGISEMKAWLKEIENRTTATAGAGR